MVESSSGDILQGADTIDVAFLVVGDPFGSEFDMWNNFDRSILITL